MQFESEVVEEQGQGAVVGGLEAMTPWSGEALVVT